MPGFGPSGPSPGELRFSVLGPLTVEAAGRALPLVVRIGTVQQP
ncbi:hypothetical protein OG223_25445 [Streptomyces sp. NBC_01478]|nr:hypothetical protein [Streptomyces sp. NBC_01478]